MQEEVSARFLHTWSQTPLTSARFLHTRSQPGPSSGTTITARAPLVATFYKNAANIMLRPALRMRGLALTDFTRHCALPVSLPLSHTPRRLGHDGSKGDGGSSQEPLARMWRMLCGLWKLRNVEKELLDKHNFTKDLSNLACRSQLIPFE